MSEQRRPRLGVMGLVVALAVFATAGLVLAMGRFDGLWTGSPKAVERPVPRAASDAPPTSPPASPSVDPSAGHVASAPLRDLGDREFELLTSTTTVVIRTADFADQLYVISTPADGNALPRVSVEGARVMLQLVPTGTKGTAAVEVRLNTRIRWHLRLTGGAVEHRIDLSGTRLSGVDFVGGATRIDLTLPRPDRSVPVQMSGGVNQFVLRLPGRVPVRVNARKGAASVQIDAVLRQRIAPGTVFKQDGWDATNQRYDVEAIAGFATLRVDRT